jgi:GST-like protein
MLGQAHHFRIYAPKKIDYAITRYTKEAHRLYGVMDTRLGESTYLAGRSYTIADIACWPWIASHARQGVELSDFPNVERWFRTIEARPAVQRGIALFADLRN